MGWTLNIEKHLSKSRETWNSGGILPPHHRQQGLFAFLFGPNGGRI